MSGNKSGAVMHGIIGTVPLVGNNYEAYHAAKRFSGGSKNAARVAAVGTTFVPFSGTVAGAYHGYHQPHTFRNATHTFHESAHIHAQQIKHHFAERRQTNG